MTWKAGYHSNYISTANANALAYVRLSGWLSGTKEDVVVTVNEEITYTTTEGEGGSAYDAVNVDIDFSDAKGELIGYFGGHVHSDTQADVGFPIITTRCDAKEENVASLKAEKVVGTATEQSFDVFTVNRKTKKIHATKIGAGSDRTIGY